MRRCGWTCGSAWWRSSCCRKAMSHLRKPRLTRSRCKAEISAWRIPLRRRVVWLAKNIANALLPECSRPPGRYARDVVVRAFGIISPGAVGNSLTRPWSRPRFAHRDEIPGRRSSVTTGEAGPPPNRAPWSAWTWLFRRCWADCYCVPAAAIYHHQDSRRVKGRSVWCANPF